MCPALQGTRQGSWANLPPAHQSPQRLDSRWGTDLRSITTQLPVTPGRSPAPTGQEKQRTRRHIPPGWHRACARLHALRVPRGNSLPNLIDDSLLLLDFIPESGQLLLMGFPVALHLLLQRLLQPRPAEMCQPLSARSPRGAKTGSLPSIPPPSAARSPHEGPGPTLLYRDNSQGSVRKLSGSHGQITIFHEERVCL